MMTKSGKRALTLAAFLALLAGRAGAQTTYYVDAAQPDDNCNGQCIERDGTPCTCGPKRVINSAMALAVDGDIVKVLPGTYNGLHSFQSDGVTLEAVGEAIITGQGVNANSGDRATIRGFTFKNISSQHGLTVQQSALSRVEYCRFIQCPWGMQGAAQGSVVRHCLFDRCGVGIWGHGGVIENCTFYQGYGSGAVYAAGATPVVRNNVFVENEAAIAASGSVWVYYNNFFGNTTPLPGNVYSICENTENPLFIDGAKRCLLRRGPVTIVDSGRERGTDRGVRAGVSYLKGRNRRRASAAAARPGHAVARLAR